ncbi:MAG: RNA-protein complex protein Nop10 [Candidatus Nitrosopelagicus sp.]|nr:RNA-protein complex protein Nop10 [Marine Group I thaumarchaeote]
MRFQLRKCSACKMYTMKDTCKKCNEPTVLVHPAKFSPDDKYLKMRMSGKED